MMLNRSRVTRGLLTGRARGVVVCCRRASCLQSSEHPREPLGSDSELLPGGARSAPWELLRRDAVVSPTPPSGTGIAERLGLKPGMIVMESGYDDDVDEDLRDGIAESTGEELVDEDTDEVVDVVLLWYREDDGDLTDILVDSISPAGRRRLHLAADPQAGPRRLRRAVRHRRGGLDRRAVPDLDRDDRQRLGRGPAGRAALVRGQAMTAARGRRRGPRLHPARPEQRRGDAVAVPRPAGGADHLLPAGVHRHLHRRACPGARRAARASRTTTCRC